MSDDQNIWPENILTAARKRVLVLTGAGISADSGIPTYRGEGGLWRRLDFAGMATLQAFLDDRQRIWSWYEERRAGVLAAAPNGAHLAIKDLCRIARDCLVITQNVDDLHERAGLASKYLVHVHGRILESLCMACGTTMPARPGDAHNACLRCGARDLRPGVVWFDEELAPADVVRIETWLQKGESDLVMAIGTTASFSYISEWATRAVGRSGLLVDINPEVSALGMVMGGRVLHIKRRAVEALPRLVDALRAAG